MRASAGGERNVGRMARNRAYERGGAARRPKRAYLASISILITTPMMALKMRISLSSIYPYLSKRTFASQKLQQK